MAASFAQTVITQTMNLDLSKVMGGAREGLDTLCTDIFLIVIRMREAEDLGDPASLRKLIGYYLNLFDKNCRSLRIDPRQMECAKYALIALLDETVLSVPGPCRDLWISNPLQLDYFGDNLAGQEFYRKLDKLLVEPEKMKDVLEVYYLCMCLGFEGRYKISNHEEREQIIDNLGRVLRKVGRRRSTSLSPHAFPLNTGKPKKVKGGAYLLPLWIVGAVSALTVAITYMILLASSKGMLEQTLKAVG